MSNTALNPLYGLANLTAYHIIIAFENSEDAYTSKINGADIDAGIMFDASLIGGTAGGKAMAIVNELVNASASVTNASTTWSFYSQHDSASTSYVGEMTIRDNSGFLFTQTLAEMTESLNMSMHHLTFAWVTVFVGVKPKLAEQVRIIPNPMYFHITRLVQEMDTVVGRAYTLDFVSCYNTYGIGPQFSTIYQNTVTNKEGRAVNSIPTTKSYSLGINSVKNEDAEKLAQRVDRLNKIKYMTTVGDFVSSFEYSLNNQQINHNIQLQELLSIVKDSYTKKIKPLKEIYPLPIEYKLSCAPYYKNKKLDNRNLPFEQNEIDQSISGISSVTFPVGYSIHNALKRVMSMSKDIGADHNSDDSTTTFKFTTTTNMNGEGKYVIHTKINNYISPYNTKKKNTAESVEVAKNLIRGKSIELTYQDKTDDDGADILSLGYMTTPQFTLSVLESANDVPDGQSVYGDREATTSRRGKTTVGSKPSDYFKTAFSGVNAVRGLNTNSGLQNHTTAAAISNFNPNQQVLYRVEIVGNPHLLGDINRNPLDVMRPFEATNYNSIGEYNIYSNIEYEPMYVKLKIYLGEHINASIVGNKKPVEPLFHYNGYMHITQIVNEFVGGGFNQYIYCNRTDENA